MSNNLMVLRILNILNMFINLRNHYRLSNFLIKNDFKRGQVGTTLFRRTLEKDILVV